MSLVNASRVTRPQEEGLHKSKERMRQLSYEMERMRENRMSAVLWLRRILWFVAGALAIAVLALTTMGK